MPPARAQGHPHRGFETVTYIIDGIIRHQDSNGGGGLITDGDTQWMTEGAGLSFWQRHRCR
jgi:quercetin 2,3-dioxygenase